MSNMDVVTDYLDSLDLGEFLWSDRAVGDAMEEIDAIYGGDYERVTGDSSFILAWSEDEFADYIRKRYGIKCYERSLLFIK